MTLDRRDFIKGAMGASGAFVLSGARGFPRWSVPPTEHQRRGTLPPPERSGIEHVVVVMMENRSFDHILGWLPGADGRQAGLSYATSDGTRHRTFHQPQLNGCGFKDPDHSYEGGRIQYSGGRMDGFLVDTENDSFAISYYKPHDRPFMARLAQRYTTCDRYFCSILGPTYPNRFFQHTASTDRLSNTLTASTLPTIWDRLNQPGGPTGRYYYSDVPFVALLGAKYLSISSKLADFERDAAAGTLPNVSFVDPSFIGEDNATANDDHPLCDLRAGDAFLSQIFHAVASGPKWANTVLVINYDEWGGFFEHVPARRVTAAVPIGADPHTGIDQDLDARGRVLTGFRVPCIVASPLARSRYGGGHVDHGFYDHTSVLKLIEWRWNLAPLSARDASTAPTDPGNLANALSFRAPDTRVPDLPLLEFTPTACAAPPTAAPATATEALVGAGGSARGVAAPSLAGREDWVALRHSNLCAGWS
jgi:phospholipase C